MSSRPKSTAVAATAVAVLMLFTAGCSGSSGPADKVSSPKSSAGPNSGPAAAPKDAVDNGAVAANIDPANPPKPVASFTASLPYDKDPKTTGRFDIYSLKRQGKLVILTFSLTPKFSTPGSAFLYSLLGGPTDFKPTLVDPVNLRVYDVVRSGAGSLSSAHTTAQTYSGAPMFLWAAFAAPPTNVQKVNLNIFDTLPTVMDVPVQ